MKGNEIDEEKRGGKVEFGKRREGGGCQFNPESKWRIPNFWQYMEGWMIGYAENMLKELLKICMFC
jgi:hypothetical protein